MLNHNEISTKIQINAADFATAIQLLKAEMAKIGMMMPPGTTDISFDTIFKNKNIDSNFPKCQLLGFCSATHAHKILQAEPIMGIFLPCHIMVTEIEVGKYEINAMNPQGMSKLLTQNPVALEIGNEIADKMKKVFNALQQQ